MRDKHRKLGFNEKDKIRSWKNHMEEIMDEENDWDHMTEGSMRGGPI